MEEWIRVGLEKVCSKVGSNYQPKESSNLPYVGLEHIESEKSMLTNHGFESEIKSSKTRFKKGQILYGKLRPYLDKAVIAPFDGICSTDILVFDSNTESMNEFLIHLIHSNEFIDHAKATTNGVQHPRTSWNSLKQFNFLLPPPLRTTQNRPRIKHGAKSHRAAGQAHPHHHRAEKSPHAKTLY